MRALILMAALIQVPGLSWGGAVELNVDEAAPTQAATAAITVAPTMATTVAPAVAATVAPTTVPTIAPTTAATPVPKATPGQDLRDVDFNKAGNESEEDGMVIIAPGSQSPEDSLESFGIESPFDWKKRGVKPLGAPKGQDAEAIELGAPDRSDLKEKVSLETAEGEALPGDMAYEEVERAGMVLSPEEYRVDGQVARERTGKLLSRRGTVIYLRMEPGRQVYPGTVYTLYRNKGLLRSGSPAQMDIGTLMVPSGVVRVIRVDGDLVATRVEKGYIEINEGDLARLRDPDRLRHINALRQSGNGPPAELNGEIIGVHSGRTLARKGDVVYLNLGRAKGNQPGLRLTVSRDVPSPPSPSQPASAQREGQAVGKIGQLEVLSITRDACSARVIKSAGELRPGDRVRLR